MAWQIKEAKRQKRGSRVVGARLVFGNGEPETIMVPDAGANAPVIELEAAIAAVPMIPAVEADENGEGGSPEVPGVSEVPAVMGPDPDWVRPEIERPNPDYRSEEKVWGVDRDQNPREFAAMLRVERDAWLAHYDREDESVPEAPNSLIEEDYDLEAAAR